MNRHWGSPVYGPILVICAALASGISTICLLKQTGGSHADEAETSMMLYIVPDKVDMSKTVKDFDPRPGRRGLTRDPKGEGTYSPSGIWGDPTLATKEKGKTIVEATVAEIIRQIREMMQDWKKAK